MNWSILICLIFLDSCRGRHVFLSDSEEDAEYPDNSGDSLNIKIAKILKLIKRRNDLSDKDDLVLELAVDPEDLPEAEPIHPGHTLIRPSLGMLKSAAKFPQKDAAKYAVYGNVNNLGITYDKSPYRMQYTGFRKTDNLVDTILEAAKNIDKTKGNGKGPSVVILKPESSSGERRNLRSLKVLISNGQMLSEEENNSKEIEEASGDESDEAGDDFRRRKRKPKSKFRERSNESSDSDTCSGSSSSSSSSDDSIEKNPGNPYTIHKNKYKQNWLWNHAMEGDHMNINPYGPEFNSKGPSGADLFFGRKWWYFTQDDYKPFR